MDLHPPSRFDRQPCYAAGGGRIYFVETADPDTRKIGNRRANLPALLGKGAILVALDLRTGDVDWKREMCWESTTLQKNTTQRPICTPLTNEQKRSILVWDVELNL